MTEYSKIGLKSGIEIHQQLDTHKLFCNCPSILRTEEPDFIVKRKLHAVAGESGEIDIAAEHEAKIDKIFNYQGYNNTTCLVELDEEPPHEINQEALKIVVQISLLLNAEILTISQIMRKTVIDGSNTSGFQRTVLIAKNGWIETEQGRVGIDSIALEEDAAKIVSKQENTATFRLDRLGIPLVEIATSPDIKSPKQAREVALHIGEILRACKVKRGIGTIRQDVNISISGSKRIEIKGVQDPRLIRKTIITEIQRQKQLVKNKQSRAEVRKAEQNGTTTFLRPLPGIARMYPETDLPLLKIPKKLIDEAKRNLPKLKSEKREKLRGIGLNEELIKLILKKDKLNDFEELSPIYKNKNLIAKLLVLWPQEIIKKTKPKNPLTLDIIETILQAINNNKITENNAKQVLREYLQGKSITESLKKQKTNISKLEQEIEQLIKNKPDLSIKAYMGLIMQKYKTQVSGKEVMDTLKKLVK